MLASPPPNRPDTTGTTQLIASVRAGEMKAWSEIDRRYRKRLALIISSRLPPGFRGRYDTEDLVQSTLMSAFKELDSFRPNGKGSFKRWLSTILRNRLISRIRYERTLKRDGSTQPEDGDQLGMLADEREDLEVVDRAEVLARTLDEASQLEGSSFRLIQRHFMEGLSLSEIARMECMPLTNVRRQMAQALDSLRIRMRQHGQ